MLIPSCADGRVSESGSQIGGHVVALRQQLCSRQLPIRLVTDYCHVIFTSQPARVLSFHGYFESSFHCHSNHFIGLHAKILFSNQIPVLNTEVWRLWRIISTDGGLLMPQGCTICHLLRSVEGLQLLRVSRPRYRLAPLSSRNHGLGSIRHFYWSYQLPCPMRWINPTNPPMKCTHSGHVTKRNSMHIRGSLYFQASINRSSL